MAIVDNIPQTDSINDETSGVFIASDNMDVNGLPILKGSLVYCNEGSVSVNVISGLALQDYNDGNKASDCEYEDVEPCNASMAVWHNNHFHCGKKPIENYKLIEHYILHYNGLDFSSLFYEFDMNRKRLSYFISEGDFSLKFENKEVFISGKNEISLSHNDDSCYVIPLTILEYGGFVFKKICYFDKNGVFSGKIAKATCVRVVSEYDADEVILSKGTKVEIDVNGLVTAKLGNRRTGRVSVVTVELVCSLCND